MGHYSDNYDKLYNLKFADIYYPPYNFKRNGCFCCGFGCNLEEENNFQKSIDQNN